MKTPKSDYPINGVAAKIGQQLEELKKKGWQKTLGITLKSMEELEVLNARLQQYKFATVADLLRAFMANKFPANMDSNAEIMTLIKQLREKNITDPTTNNTVQPDFYKRIDMADFKKHLYGKYTDKYYANSLYNYFERYQDIFFLHPELIQNETPKVREYTTSGMKAFATYFDKKNVCPAVKVLVDEIIKRYELTKNVNRHNKILIVNDEFVYGWTDFITKRYQKGDLSVIIQFAIRSGLREVELDFCHDMPICDKGFCKCDNLHVFDYTEKFGHVLVITNRHVGKKHSYFTVIPSALWEAFRKLQACDYNIRQSIIKNLQTDTNGKVELKTLRKLQYSINYRSELRFEGAEVLAGRAKTTSAQHYLLNQPGETVQLYAKAWQPYPLPEGLTS